MTTLPRLPPAVLLCSALVTVGAEASTGGEDVPPDFVSPWGPVRPWADLAKGPLGVVEESWWRKPLLLAWYRFNGDTVPDGILEVLAQPVDISAYLGTDEQVPAMKPWREEARAAAPDLDPGKSLWPTTADPFDQLGGFMNCPNAAWEQARQTLAERTQAWGANSPALRDWITMQHRVFQRCPLGPKHFLAKQLPEAFHYDSRIAESYLLPDMSLPGPPKDAPPLLRADRAYQRAAALLYEGHYVEAERAFRAIAANAASPWRPWGDYLALRARLRAIQIMPPVHLPSEYCENPECQLDRTAYRAFRQREPARLLADVKKALEAARPRGDAAEIRRLSDLHALVASRFEPAVRFRELAPLVTRPIGDPAAFKATVTDYLYLHRQRRLDGPLGEPLSEWLAGLIEGGDPTGVGCKATKREAIGPRERMPDRERKILEKCLRAQWSAESLARFERAPTQYAWLFSAAALASPGDAHLKPLMAVLARVPDVHPGAASFLLHRVRLGERAEALRVATALMQRPEVQADHSARNQLRRYRMPHAETLAEFWADAVREGGRGYDRDTGLAGAAPSPASPHWWGWDSDALWVLNYELPHAALLETAQRAGWTEELRARVANIAWGRAVLRRNAVQAREALAVVSRLTIGEQSEPVRAARKDELARLAAIQDDTRFLLESAVSPHGPGARLEGSCRLATPKPDAYVPDYEERVADFPARFGRMAERLLTIEAHTTWRKERAELDALPDLVTLSMQTRLEFAERYPQDARVPDLLKEAVYATRRNWCTDESAGQLSKKAFDLLKRKYAKSEAARTTKYWFKPRM